MNCTKATSLLSLHLDGALEIRERRVMDDHLAKCAECKDEFSSLQQTRQLLAVVGRKPAPENLALRVRLAISREASAVRVSPLREIAFPAGNSLERVHGSSYRRLVERSCIFRSHYRLLCSSLAQQ